MAKINRFTRLSPSRGFTPRSVEEIMMVPLAKQQQHNKAEEALGELSDFDYNRMAGDNEVASQELADYRAKVDEAVGSLAETGVSSVNRAKVLELNRELKKNMSSEGTWGKRKANYDAYKAWTEEMKKKENRGGWSPRDVDTFMKMQSAGFKTEGEDGTFNQFSGGYLPEKVDEIKMFNDLLKNVPEEIMSASGLNPVLKLDFDTVFNEKIVKGKSREKIFDYIRGVMGNDAKVRESIATANMLNGINEKDPFAKGQMVTKIDPATGEEQEVYQPGSRFDSKLMSFAAGAAGITDISNKYITLTDRTGVAAMNARIKKLADQEESDAGIVHIEQMVLQEGFGVKELEELTWEMDNLDGAIEQDIQKLENIAKNDPEGKDSRNYKLAKAQYDQRAIKLQSLKSRVEDVNSRGADMLNTEDKKVYDAIGGYENLIKGEDGLPFPEDAQILNLQKATESPNDNNLASLKQKYFERKGIVLPEKWSADSEVMPAGATMAEIRFSNQLNESAGPTRDGFPDIDGKIAEVKRQVSKNAFKVIGEERDAGMGAVTAKVFSSGDAKLFNTPTYEIITAIEKENFNPESFSSSESGLSIVEEYGNKFGAGDTDWNIKATEVMPMTSTSSKGNDQFVLQFYTNEGSPIKQLRVTMGEAGRNLFRSMGNSMIRSTDPTTAATGLTILSNQVSPITKGEGLEENTPAKSGVMSSYSYDNKPVAWSKKTNSIGQFEYTLNMGGVLSQPITNMQDVNKYIYIADMFTNTPAGSVENQRARALFINAFGEKEMKKFIAEIKE